MHHVAIMKKSWGLLEKIKTGQKTIESRWYVTKHTPWGKITEGDIIYFKDSGEPVSVQATAGKVLQFSGLTPQKARSLLDQYYLADGIELENLPRYYKLFKDKKYCILVFLKSVRHLSPFNINKKGFGAMSAWVIVDDINTIRVKYNRA